jgi:RHS repeat-associated protein
VGATTVYYIHPDHLNTTRLIQDQAGNTVWRWDQGEPFGNDVPNNNPSGAGAFDFPLRFPGQYFDGETNLAYNWMRDYDPGIGRYVESDPIGLKGGLNTYAYVSASPLTQTDATGLAVWLCLRGVHGSPLGNHTYFYDDKTRRCCGDTGAFSKDPLNSCKEAGPGKGGDTCTLISSNDSDTEKLLKCCNTKTNKQFYFPLFNDCQDVVDDCIREIGMAPPSTPNKNRWARCPSCWRQ